ncbi:DUF6655 family protein [Oleispirillum naphthae]|uniref:DUF6655 family protein n=1 Tax=Oleispirillum naphthae TaxID=2838853 RepID=UPI0030823A69
MPRRFAVALACLALAACTTERQTTTSRTATEQLLISAAADRAAVEVVRAVPPGKKTFVDAGNFEATDGKYAIGAIRAAVLARGALLAAERKDAEVVVEIRAGALGIDNSDTIVGLPEYKVPVPLAGSDITTPKIALFEKARQLGVAKFAAAIYDAKTGAALFTGPPRFGFARKNDYTAALVISWQRDDIHSVEDAPPATLTFYPSDDE